MNKFYMIPNTKEVDKFNEELILPLKDFSVGFDVYFTLEEIKEISKSRKVSVVINSFLHKDLLNNLSEKIKTMDYVNLFFVEDLGLTNIIDKKRIVLFQNHIINNYDAINSFKDLGIESIVVSNELTLDEIRVIREKTTSNLFYFLINRNMLMYSKRKLISSFYEYKNENLKNRTQTIVENVSKKPLIIKEENGVTSIFNSKIFSANEYLDYFNNFNFIINFSNLNEEESEYIRKYYNSKDLKNYIETLDNYFLLNKIIYKVGEK